MNTAQQTSWRPPGGAQENRFFAFVRRLNWDRSENRWIGGVCGGFSAKTGWDVSLVRGVVAVLSLFFAFPIVLYALAWLLLPDARNGKIELEEALAGRFDSAQLLAGLLLFFSLFNPFMWGTAISAPWYSFGGLIVVTVVVAIAIGGRNSSIYKAQRGSTMPNQNPQQGQNRGPTMPGIPYSAPPAGAPFPAPAPSSFAPGAPTLPSSVGLSVIGVLFLFGAAAAASNLLGLSDFPWFVVWCAVSLVVLGVTLAIGALSGRRGGWLLGLSIVFAIIAGPTSLGIAANYQSYDEYMGGVASFPSSTWNLEDEDDVIVDENPQLESGVFSLGSDTESFTADATVTTLDLTDAADLTGTDKVIEGDVDSSILIIKVNPDDAFNYDINGTASKISVTGTPAPDWLPKPEKGSFSLQNEEKGTLTLKLNTDATYIKFEIDN